MKRSPFEQLQIDIVKSADRNFPEMKPTETINYILGAAAVLAGDLASRSRDPDRAVELFAEAFKSQMIRCFEHDVWRKVEGIERYPLQRLRAPGKEEMQ